MPKKILLVEDEEEFAKLLTSYLKKNGFDVSLTFSVKGAWRKLQENSYHLMILDLSLPDEDSLELCKKIREKESLPILILTARDGISEKVAGFNAGADDYLVKPASLKELVARINRLIARDLKGSFRSSIFRFNGIEFETTTGKLASKSRVIKLTQKERAMLEFLLLRKGQALDRMEIMDHIWGNEISPFSNTVNMGISSLRRKLGQLSKKKFIQSVHGLGYKFEDDS